MRGTSKTSVIQSVCTTLLYGAQYQSSSVTNRFDGALSAMLADSVAESLQLSTTKRWLQQSWPCMSVFVRISLMRGLTAFVYA